IWVGLVFYWFVLVKWILMYFAGDYTDVGIGEATFDESTALHGSNGSLYLTTIYTLHRRKRVKDPNREGEDGSFDHILARGECNSGVFSKLDELLGYKAHKCPHFAGFGQWES